MIPEQLLKQVRQLEIKTRRIVSSTFAGEYHSIFKGTGINFDEVREYQQGDDVRRIDWNVTARTGVPYIKLFREERELTVLLMVDISASGNFGSDQRSKVSTAAEIAALIGFSANLNNDRVGLLLFSEQVERYIPPKKGKKHMFRLLRDIYYKEPTHKGTDIQRALDYVYQLQKKHTIIFLISDFIDEGYEKSLKMVGKRHELIPIILEDPLENELPDAGILTFQDAESGRCIYLNSASSDIRKRFHNIMYQRQRTLDRLFKSMGVMSIKTMTNQSCIEPLQTYFKQRLKTVA